MTCSMTQLDAIIAACGGCKPVPSKRLSVIADEVSPNLAAPGMTYQSNFNGVPMVDSKGRIAHVRGLTIETSVTLAFNGTVNAAPAVSSHLLRSLVSDIKIQGRKNHLYTESIDLRDVIDDSWARNLRIKNSRPLAPDFSSSGSNPGVTDGDVGYPVPDQFGSGFGFPGSLLEGTQTVDLTTDIWFTTDGENPTHGLVPLFELITAVNGSLRFKLGSGDLADAGQGPVTVQSFSVPETDGSVAIRIWLHLVYLDALVIDPLWKVDSYTVNRLKGSLRYLDSLTRYAAVRNHEEEADLEFVDSLATSSLTLDVAGFTEIAGLSADRMRSRLMELLCNVPASEHQDFNRSVSLPAFVPTNAANAFGPGNRTREIDLLVAYQGRRSLNPAGPVNYQFSGWGNSGEETFQRVLHRTIVCQDMQRVKEAARKAYGAAAGQCGCTRVADDGGTVQGTGSGHETVIITRRR